jgi:hypothetical protein
MKVRQTMDYSGKSRAVRPLRPEDDFNHPVEAHPFFNESRYIHLIDGTRRIGGWFRIGNRPNQGFAEMTVCLYLPDGRAGFMHSKPQGHVDDCRSADGLSFEITEPLRRMSVHYAGPLCVMADGREMDDPKQAFQQNPRLDCTVALQFEAVAPVHGGELLADDGTPYDEGDGRYFARAHFDQSMRGRGVITVGDERFEIDGFGLRDHSWGPRLWQAIPWYRWFPCTFDDGFAICLMMVKKGDGEYLETGFIHDGSGRLLHVSDIRLCSEYDERQHPTGFTLTCRDELGRHYDMRGETLSAVPCRHVRRLPDGSSDRSRIMESMTRYTCNGRVGFGLAEYMDHVSDGAFEGIVAGH